MIKIPGRGTNEKQGKTINHRGSRGIASKRMENGSEPSQLAEGHKSRI